MSTLPTSITSRTDFIVDETLAARGQFDVAGRIGAYSIRAAAGFVIVTGGKIAMLRVRREHAERILGRVLPAGNTDDLDDRGSIAWPELDDPAISAVKDDPRAWARAVGGAMAKAKSGGAA